MHGLFAFLFTIPNYFYRAWVLSVLWGWFVVTSLGLPPLGMAAAFGLSLTAGFFLPGSTIVSTKNNILLTKDRSKEEANVAVWADAVISYLFTTTALGVGWLTRMFL